MVKLYNLLLAQGRRCRMIGRQPPSIEAVTKYKFRLLDLIKDKGMLPTQVLQIKCQVQCCQQVSPVVADASAT